MPGWLSLAELLAPGAAKKTRVVLAILGVFLLGVYFETWRSNRAEIRPRPAKEARYARKWPRYVEEVPVRFAEPPPEARKRVARDFGRPDLDRPPEGQQRPRVIGVYDLGVCPPGTKIEALAVLEPSGDLSLVSRPRKNFVGLPAEFTLYGEVLSGDLRAERLAVRLGAELAALRLGSFTLSPKVEAFRDPLPFGGYDHGVRGGVRLSLTASPRSRS